MASRNGYEENTNSKKKKMRTCSKCGDHSTLNSRHHWGPIRPFDEQKNIHFDNEKDIHISSETTRESGHGLDLDLVIILYQSCVS